MENPTTGASSGTHQSSTAVGSTSLASSRRYRRSTPRVEVPLAPAAAAKRNHSCDDSAVSDAQCRKRARKSLDSSQKERKAGPISVAGTVPPAAKDDDTPCCICMCDIDRPDLSSIDGCTHQYCFDCIAKWAKTENTCPQCKTRFTKISRVHLIRSSSGKRCSKRDPNNTLTVSHRSQQERSAALEGMAFRGASGNPIYFDSEDDDAVAFAVGLALSLQYVSGETLHEELARHLRHRARQESSEDEDEDDEEEVGLEEGENGDSVETGGEQAQEHSHTFDNVLSRSLPRSVGVASYVEQAPPIPETAATLAHGATVTTAIHSNMPLSAQVLQEQQLLQVQTLREMERLLPPFVGQGRAVTSGLRHLFPPPSNHDSYHAPPPSHGGMHNHAPPPSQGGMHNHHYNVNTLAELRSSAANSLLAGRQFLPMDFHQQHQAGLIMPSRFAPPPPSYHQPTHHGISISNLTVGNGLSHLCLTDLFFPALAGLHHQLLAPPAPAHHSLVYPMSMSMGTIQAGVHPGVAPGALFPSSGPGLPLANANTFIVQHSLPPPLTPVYPTSTSQYHPSVSPDLLNAEFFYEHHDPYTHYPPAPDRSHMP